MQIEEVKEYFGGTLKKVADALGISHVAVLNWGKRGGGIPLGRQYQIEVISDGKLTVSGGGSKANAN